MQKIKVLKKPSSFVIDYRKWVNAGEPGTGYSSLLNEEGNMCCIGFYGRACGMKPGELINNGGPEDCDRAMPGLVEIEQDDTYEDDIFQYIWNNKLAEELITINDNILDSSKTFEQEQKERMLKIQSRFKKIKVSVKYKNVPKEIVDSMTKLQKAQLLAR